MISSGLIALIVVWVIIHCFAAAGNEDAKEWCQKEAEKSCGIILTLLAGLAMVIGIMYIFFAW